MRVVFMGTPRMAVPALEALVESDHTVIAVVTQPDRPKGRGGKVIATPVKAAAGARGIPVLQPEKVRDADFIGKLQALDPEVAVVIAFGQILPQALLDIPKFGCINIHASILPAYRGAAPINWAIANGDTETGLTTMQMDAGMDTGAVYLTHTTSIGPDEDAEELTERLSAMAGPIILETLEKVAEGMTPTPQDDSRATMAPLMKKGDGRIDWSRPARDVHNRIRAFSPWPGSHTDYAGEPWKVTRARIGESPALEEPPGRVLRVDGDSILVATGDGTIRILALQTPGKRAMPVRDFLNGHPVEPGIVLGA
ncbi:MAG: methionyl-tRNA formyltransferase [Leptospirillia bacterium]